MNNICPLCGTEYILKKYYKSNLCDSCLRKKRKIDSNNRVARYREKHMPLIYKTDPILRPYVYRFNNLGYNVVDARDGMFIFEKNVVFENIPDGWHYDNSDDYIILKSESKKRLVTLGRWIYYNLEFKNIK